MLSDKDFSELLEKYNYSFKVGNVVEGELIAFEGNNLLVDINAKASAVCLSNEILISKNQNVKDLFEIGKRYEFVINSQENEEGIFYLSHRKVALSKNIEILKEKFEQNEIVIGVVHNVVKGGLIVNVMGVKGFVPSSQLRNEEEKVGNEIELKILSLNMEQNNFILSSKKIYNDTLEVARKEIFARKGIINQKIASSSFHGLVKLLKPSYIKPAAHWHMA